MWIIVTPKGVKLYKTKYKIRWIAWVESYTILCQITFYDVKCLFHSAAVSFVKETQKTY